MLTSTHNIDFSKTHVSELNLFTNMSPHYFNIDFDKIDVKMLILKAYFLVVMIPVDIFADSDAATMILDFNMEIGIAMLLKCMLFLLIQINQTT